MVHFVNGIFCYLKKLPFVNDINIINGGNRRYLKKI